MLVSDERMFVMIIFSCRRVVSADDYGQWLFDIIILAKITTTKNHWISIEFKFTKWIRYCRRSEISFDMYLHLKLRSNRYLLASQRCFDSIISLRCNAMIGKKTISINENQFFIFSFQSIAQDEDDNTDKTFLAVTIISTIEIRKTHMDMHGLYQCVGVYKEIYAQQTFHVNVISNGTRNFLSNEFVISTFLFSF